MRLLSCLLLFAFTLAFAPCHAAPKNVVLFVVDDQGLDAGCYGNKVIKTPHLDRLAAAGTRFDYAFCTTASCSASRSVILTGLHNHANGQFGHMHSYHNFHTHKSVQSLPVLLAKAGYRTCSIGKYHVQPEEVYHFQSYIQRVSSRSPVEMANRCKEFIAADKERPFFLYFCTSDPHRAGKGFANDRKYPGVTPVKYDPEDIPVPHFLPDYPETREELAEYYQSVSRLDQGLGRLVEILKETGQWESTLFLYLSDNGIPFPGAKTCLYDPGMRLPLVVRSPGQTKRGGATKAMVNWADLTPTILDFAGATGPPMHGKSFLSVLDEEDPEGFDHVFASHTFHEITMYYPMRVIRTRKYKYILNLAHPLPFPFASDLFASRTWQGVLKREDAMFGSRQVEDYIHRPLHELYDLENDPHEVKNLADDPKHAAVFKDLQARLRKWRYETKDPWVVKYQYE